MLLENPARARSSSAGSARPPRTPHAAELVRETVTRDLVGLASAITADRPDARAVLIGSHVVGTALARYVVLAEPLASMRARRRRRPARADLPALPHRPTHRLETSTEARVATSTVVVSSVTIPQWPCRSGSSAGTRSSPPSGPSSAARRRAGCARARGRGGHRQVDALARGRRACAFARVARALVATGRGRARTRSRGARRSARRRPRRGPAVPVRAEAAGARGRAPARGGGRGRGRSAGARDRDPQRACSCSPKEGRCSSRSTICSGSTRRRRPRSRSRCEGSGRRRCSCCSHGEPAAARSRPASRWPSVRRASEQLPVRPLSVGALHQFLRDRLGRPFARQTLLRIHERSGGNPFFALELGRVLDADVDPVAPLPVPETLEALVRGRISGLPASTREALALASALGTPSASLLERAGVPADALEPALAAHVIERENGTIRFTHPLLVVRALRRPGRGAAERARADRRDRRRPAPPRPSPRALDGTRRTPRSQACSTTPRGWRPNAAPRRSRPSSPSRRCG